MDKHIPKLREILTERAQKAAIDAFCAKVGWQKPGLPAIGHCFVGETHWIIGFHRTLAPSYTGIAASRNYILVKVQLVEEEMVTTIL